MRKGDEMWVKRGVADNSAGEQRLPWYSVGVVSQDRREDTEHSVEQTHNLRVQASLHLSYCPSLLL